MGSSGDNTVVVGLIGAGIGPSLSPALHEREAALLGFDYEYRLLDLDELGRPASEVGALVREARATGLRGLNITHPCKQLVVDDLDELSPEAAALGAVNTVVFATGARSATTPTRAASARRSRAACRARAPSGSCCSARAGRAPRSPTRCWRWGRSG